MCVLSSSLLFVSSGVACIGFCTSTTCFIQFLLSTRASCRKTANKQKNSFTTLICLSANGKSGKNISNNIFEWNGMECYDEMYFYTLHGCEYKHSFNELCQQTKRCHHSLISYFFHYFHIIFHSSLVFIGTRINRINSYLY